MATSDFEVVRLFPEFHRMISFRKSCSGYSVFVLRLLPCSQAMLCGRRQRLHMGDDPDVQRERADLRALLSRMVFCDQYL